MTRAADVVRLSGYEYDRLMDEREILRQEASRAWREVDFIAKERTEHLKWREKLANELAALEEALRALADAADRVGVRHFDTDWLDDEVQAMKAATLRAREVLGPNARVTGPQQAAQE